MDGQKIRTMEEFAAVSGISRPTVSKYFNDPSSVRPSTRDRIERAIKRYDYRPNFYAINQNRRLTKHIGIVVPYLADPFFAEIARRIERRCIDAGFWPLLFNAHGQQDLEINALDTLQSLKPAGALIAPLGTSSDLKIVEKFCGNVPTVLFDSNLDIGQTFVGSDNFHNVGLIVDYLCRTGEPPCFFEMPPLNPNAVTRRHAYVQAMERLGYAPEIIHVEGTDWSFEQIGFEQGGRLIAGRGLPTDTVLCSNDRLAIGLLAAAYESGRRVGRGPGCAMRIAGHDDHPWSRFTCPPLTTVAQDFATIAERSVEALFNLMTGDERLANDRQTFLEGKLVMRASA